MTDEEFNKLHIGKIIPNKALSVESTNKCNLSCTECVRGIPYFKKDKHWFLNPKQWEQDLHKIFSVIAFESVHFDGGEPSLHPNIVELVKITKQAGLVKQVGIATNSIQPNKISEELLEIVDCVSICVYPIANIQAINDFTYKLATMGWTVTGSTHYPAVIQKHVKITIPTDFFITFRKDSMPIQRNNCWLHRSCYSYAQGYLYTCSAAHFLNLMLWKKICDGVKLSDADYQSQLHNMMILNDNYKACEFCHIPFNQRTTMTQSTKEQFIQLKGLVG